MTKYLRNMVIGMSLVTMALTECGNGAKAEITITKQEEIEADTTAARTSEKETSVDQSGSQTERAAKGTEEGEKKTYKSGFTGWVTGSFPDTCCDGVMKVVNKKGGEAIRIEGKTDGNYQLGVIGNFIAQDVDCVFYNLVDAKAAGPALKLLQETGISAVNFDLIVADLDMVTVFVAMDHYSVGKVVGESIVKSHPEGGKIAILDRTNDNAAAQQIQGLLDTVEGKGFEVAARLDAGGKPETGLSTIEDILQANSDLVVVYYINDEYAQGAYSVVKASGEKVGIYSANGGPKSKATIKRDGAGGIWKMNAAQSSFTVEKESAGVTYKILEDEDYEKETLVPTFTVDATSIDQHTRSD